MRLAAALIACALFCVAFYRLAGPFIGLWIDDWERYWMRLLSMYIIGAAFAVGILMLPAIILSLLGDDSIVIGPVRPFLWGWAKAANLFGLACIGFCLVGDGIARYLEKRKGGGTS